MAPTSSASLVITGMGQGGERGRRGLVVGGACTRHITSPPAPDTEVMRGVIHAAGHSNISMSVFISGQCNDAL